MNFSLSLQYKFLNMAKKKKITSKQLVSFYMEYVLENDRQPTSIYNFAKENNFEEADFYKFYGNFESLEQDIFKSFFDETHKMLEKSEDYINFDARNKLLSFYFTFFELLTANRSYVVHVLQEKKSTLKSLKILADLRKSFTHYIETLDIETLDLKNKQLDALQTKSLKEGAWMQLLITLKFWLDDTSASFEKTDIFIEKAVNTSFDLIGIQPVKSVIDLGKFLFKEKMTMN